MRRVIAATAIVLGAGMLLVPPALSLFSRTSAAEKLTDDIRPAMTDRALAQTRAEFDTGRAALGQFADQGVPRMAADLGQSPAQFRASIDAQFPDVAGGIRQLPAITTFVDGAINLFDANRAKFHSACAAARRCPRSSSGSFISSIRLATSCRAATCDMLGRVPSVRSSRSSQAVRPRGKNSR